MAPKSLQFVLEEMLQWAPAPVLARHRYGCRVLDWEWGMTGCRVGR